MSTEPAIVKGTRNPDMTLFDQLMEATTDGVVVTNLDGRIVAANAFALQLLCGSELVGCDARVLFGAEVFAESSARGVPLSDGTVVELRVKSFDTGHIVIVRPPVQPEPRAETNIQLHIDHSSEPIVVHTQDLKVLEANQAAADLYQVPSPAQLVGRNLVEFAHPDEVLRAAAVVDRQNTQLKATDYGDWKLVRSDGVAVEVQARSLRLFRNGSPVVLTQLRDTTRERRAQTQILLSSRLASVGTVAAGVVHELRSPLAAIVGNLDLAATRVEESGYPLEDVSMQLADAREAADRMREILRDLSVFSRGDEPVLGPVEVERVLESSVRVAWHSIRQRAQFRKRLSPVPPVRGTEGRLGQLFLNLLVNATQAIPEGDATANEIDVALSTESSPTGTSVVIQISDSGVGIPNEILGRVFDEYFTTKPAGEGTGLGLAICRRIVESLGGEIFAKSPRVDGRKGTTFTVRLPALPEGTIVRQRSISPSLQASFKRQRILVIDDEPMIRSLVSRILRDHEVVECDRSTDALPRLRSEPFDAVLCDLSMPGLAGDELYRRIAADLPDLSRHVVMLTGGVFGEGTRDFVERHRIPLLQKPFTPEELKAALRRVSR